MSEAARILVEDVKNTLLETDSQGVYPTAAGSRIFTYRKTPIDVAEGYPIIVLDTGKIMWAPDVGRDSDEASRVNNRYGGLSITLYIVIYAKSSDGADDGGAYELHDIAQRVNDTILTDPRLFDPSNIRHRGRQIRAFEEELASDDENYRGLWRMVIGYTFWTREVFQPRFSVYPGRLEQMNIDVGAVVKRTRPNGEEYFDVARDQDGNRIFSREADLDRDRFGWPPVEGGQD